MAADLVIPLQTPRSIHLVQADDIICIQCESYVCDVTLVNDTVIPVAKPLCYYEGILPEASFVRISRSHIINVKHIVEIRTIDVRKRTCHLSNGEELIISYRRWPDLKRRILK